MPAPDTCPKCKAPLSSALLGSLCPRCLMVQASSIRIPGSSRPRHLIPVPSPHELDSELDTFAVMGIIGRGGMGAVYEAFQPTLERTVAIKVMPVEGGDDIEFAERFSREARALAKLDHPNIVSIFDFGQGSKFFYFVMEYVDGTDLARRLADGPIPPEETADIMLAVCDAVAYAHGEGVTHRDLKPGNILLGQNGTVKIADFGLAKVRTPDLHEFHDDQLTLTESQMGTPQYTAPELLQSGANQATARTDVYALGVVLYEMLTGLLPTGDFPLPSAKSKVRKDVDRAVLRAIAAEPEQRFASVDEFRNALSKAFGREKKPGWFGWAAAALFASATAAAVAIITTSQPETEPSGSYPVPPGIDEIVGPGVVEIRALFNEIQAELPTLVHSSAPYSATDGTTGYAEVLRQPDDWTLRRATGSLTSPDGSECSLTADFDLQGTARFALWKELQRHQENGRIHVLERRFYFAADSTLLGVAEKDFSATDTGALPGVAYGAQNRPIEVAPIVGARIQRIARELVTSAGRPEAGSVLPRTRWIGLNILERAPSADAADYTPISNTPLQIPGTHETAAAAARAALTQLSFLPKETPETSIILTDTLNPSTVVVTHDGLPQDPAHHGKRYHVTLTREGDTWTATSIAGQVRCKPGRGHEEWSTAPCF